MKRKNLLDIQKELFNKGELCNEQVVSTKSENMLGQALINGHLRIIPNFMLEGRSFDFKLKEYPILIECDGGVHKEEQKRIKDYRKDRIAQKHGFKVLRFSNGEIRNNLRECIGEIKIVANSIGKQPKEIWLYKYTVFDMIRNFFKKEKMDNDKYVFKGD